MRTWILTALLLAAPAIAQDYPAASGFVNDLAHQLTPQAVAALEAKVRDYQTASGNEVGVAIVPSLNGQLIDDYARGLFHAWGVGKQGLNNGVLFVWAPHERRIRIQVGLGLERALTDTQAGLILARVREMFRRNEYEAGVNAAVDGIIATLGTAPTTMQELQEQQRQAGAEREAEKSANIRVAPRVAGIVAWVLVLGYLAYRRWRGRRLAESWPGELADADRALEEAKSKQGAARAAVEELKKEAPEEVWQRYDVTENWESRRADLDKWRLAARGSYREMKAAHHGLAIWQDRMSVVIERFEAAARAPEVFRAQREQAQAMLKDVPARLTRMEGAGGLADAEGLFRAAANTYEQALEKSRENPANWLMVCDLLADVAACLDQIENPATRARYRPARVWMEEFDSPAANALDFMYQQQAAAAAASAPSSAFDAGSSGGGGSFGGGDTGGGGASSDY